MSIIQKLRGAGVALTTPFLNDGTIDYNSLEKQIEHVINGGIDFLVLFGTTGESVTIFEIEKETALKFVINKIAGRVPLVLGIGSNNTADLVTDILNFDFKGVDAIMSVCPYYNKPNQDGIYYHFKAVSEATDMPIIIYNVPGRSVVNIEPSTTLKIAENLKNVIGIKEATDNIDQVMELISKKPKDFLVIAGDDSLALPFMSLGADGAISVIANAFPKEFSDIIHYAANNDYVNARKAHYKILPLMHTLLKSGNPAGIKAAVNIRGLCEYYFRLPVYGVNDEQFEIIKKEVLKLLNN